MIDEAVSHVRLFSPIAKRKIIIHHGKFTKILVTLCKKEANAAWFTLFSVSKKVKNINSCFQILRKPTMITNIFFVFD